MEKITSAGGAFSEAEAVLFRRSCWKASLWFVLAGTLAVWIHSILTYYLAPPFDNPIDVLLWLVVWCGKLGAALAMPLLVIRRTALHIHRNGRRALIAFAAFVLPVMLFAYGCHPFRALLAPMINSGAQKYYPLAATANSSVYPGWEQFIAHWRSGVFFVYEFLAVAATAGVVVGAGWLWGRRPWLTTLFVTPLAWLTFLLIAATTQLCVVDYDFFLGSTALGPAALDLFTVVLPTDGASEFGLVIALLILIAGYALDRRWSPQLEPAPAFHRYPD